MNKKVKLIKTSLSSLLLQLLTIICGFILPRLIIQVYGSETNGLINSISQFLQLITFLELGVGAVVQSALYKPLAKKNYDDISKVITSAGRFYRTIAKILIVYIILLIIIYPLMISSEYDIVFTAVLIISMSFSLFAQYYFGIVDKLLLNADQLGYIQYISQIVVLIINTFISVILIKLNQPIHLVKFVSSIIFLIRPLIIRIYVNKHYKINRNFQYDKDPISQKWNGLALHVSSTIIDGTDQIVLTIFSTLKNVSIYSVYHSVVYGIKYIFLSLINGFQSILGELWAKDDYEKLDSVFARFEWLMHTLITFIFGCCLVLILPFIKVYTAGITSDNYIDFSFAIVIVIAHMLHCISHIYNTMIKAAGKFKDTQKNYIIAALVNIVISIFTVKYIGLLGVAIGTLVAMLYQTVWMINYISKNIINKTVKSMMKQMFVNFLTIAILYIISFIIKYDISNYFDWFVYAVIISLLCIFVIYILNMIFYKKNIIKILITEFKHILFRKDRNEKSNI